MDEIWVAILAMGAVLWGLSSAIYEQHVKKPREEAENKKKEKEAKELDRQIRLEMEKEKNELQGMIINLLKDKGGKISVSDIDAFLKNNDLEMTKDVCKTLYNDGEISFAGNGRYFILNEEKKQPKKASARKSQEVDVEKELEKLKGLLDKGLITQEQYETKSNKLLGL